jgi:hypothetical protein
MMRALSTLAVAVYVILCTGCATKTLWEEGRFVRFREPASPSNLQLFQAANTNKLLIAYDEETDEGTHQKRRAFWADLTEEPPRNPFRPDFTTAANSRQLRSLPLVQEPAPHDLSAITTNNARAFILFKDGQQIWTQPLPVYEDRSGRTKQIALTPVTIVADITIIGGIILFYWLQGASGSL